MKENKVYYGEYSLEHWINLILTKDIILPEYQRYFVWTEEQVFKFIVSIRDSQFIPPVTIGRYKDKNIIIDGQQRLTSLFLAYLGVFPNRESIKTSSDLYNGEGEEVEEKDIISANMIEWKLNALTDNGVTKRDIISGINKDNYIYLSNSKGNNSEVLELMSDEKFMEEHFLGFSYIVPANDDVKSQQNYYSSLFLNINTSGTPLSKVESRESLYYINESYKDLFSPNFISEFRVDGKKIDFVRVLSFLFQYKNDGEESSIAKGYARNLDLMEKYFVRFIYDVIEDRESELFGKFSKIFKDKGRDELNRLSKNIELMNLSKKYESIIDFDIYIFGLVYFSLFSNKNLDKEKLDKLKENLSKEINDLKSEEAYRKSPNTIGRTKGRLKSSIELYEDVFYD